MPDSVTPGGVNCEQAAIHYTITTEGEGHAGTKAAALDAARAVADAKGALMPTCPAACDDERESIDPPFDAQPPTYERFGSGWKCKVERRRVDSLRCKKKPASADRGGR